jgi:membrane protein required for colicin V production
MNALMNSLPINAFDAAIYIFLFLAVVMGFSSGLLRSLATIIGYLAAAPIAVTAAPYLTPILISQFKLPPAQAWIGLAGIFLFIGLVLGALLRLAISELVGPDISIPDRLAGAILGAVRIGLLAVLMVVIFDRIIPAGREPAFLTGSQWRPVLSRAGQAGLKSLPPDIANYIDRLKRARGL